MNLLILLQAQAQPSIMPTFIMIGGMIVFFYFFMIRPQMKKQKQEKNFQESLKPGRMVVTTSGIHGRVSQVTEDGVILETMAGKLKFEKAAISRDFTQNRFPDTKEVVDKK
ncbi:preprotein translocase subunit YajC [Riemerella anatipestifer]|uniref:Sec translocon accessory complex subunit YajC n=2 Tax=Riemerella anatipestifer TaxID=34085 RepID=E4TCS8_RIEAD|nr:preprotein translocase subunit YajC [Riemerella anatipestifer]ADQ82587.1 protein translocase subunit yajC [Riemerella anatipestifer ATCC 11845 = DSM 15868]ADZ11921.1 YajC [Riemerella anatipestifer RA-GD]AFD56597.1 protein translocase subunit yajc [Riemerella anatipestifer ATCC 11845 = DSM 15868]AKP69778.1 protein translocase subunit yajc [Riemerella anatipestifer]AKQ39682.1 preprotein translocase subunit YajC [Riemerella anatipestifer Yb2]